MTPSRPAPSNRCSHSAATRTIAGDRREVDRGRGVLQQPLELSTAVGLRHFAEIAALGGEQVEGDERRRRRPRQLLDARRRRVQAHLQRVEVQPVSRGDDDFPVDDAAVGQLREDGVVHVGEIAIQRPQLPALDVGAAAAAKDDGAEAVPFRLEEHTFALGKL